MTAILNMAPFWLIAILMLGLLILVHELGHFLMGRALGFKIVEFGIGFGPKLIKWERKGIKYSLRAFPLGGFVAFYGEDADKPDEPGAMNNMPWYKRLIVLASGVGFNLIFAIILSVILFGSIGRQVSYVAKIESDAPIAQTGLQVGDEILAVDGKEPITVNHVASLIAAAPSDDVTLTVMRDGKELTFTADKYEREKVMYIGITPSAEFVKQGFFPTIGYALKYDVWMAEEMYKVLGKLVVGQVDVNTLSGPISTIGVIGESVQLGAQEGAYAFIMSIIELLLIISVNLAIFNILPIPALDGFRMLMVVIERIRRKPINRDLEAKINFAGFAVLIGLVLLLELYKLFS